PYRTMRRPLVRDRFRSASPALLPQGILRIFHSGEHLCPRIHPKIIRPTPARRYNMTASRETDGGKPNCCPIYADAFSSAGFASAGFASAAFLLDDLYALATRSFRCERFTFLRALRASG